ncbi:hypothetical protein [Bacillus sp. BP-3]|uniref:hypothetical protein n=1 Tax=Bacillus sp. BP-3 TaxID=3022773 RepID=UPI00232BE04E|nr:hypothetical protein [Bacillus sp. BP-3]MDC2865353.1 hypothetical protein [Bacillus sp. BP-3]
MKRYDAREKTLMDEAAGIAHALNKGREQGKMQLIQGIYKNGVSVQDIAKMTGLSEAEIQRFLQS